ncbi:MAG: rod shape-determining protein RodA [Acidimicrobiales bacterium]
MITSPRVAPAHRRVLSVDFVLIGASLLVSVVGVVMVYTATRGPLLAAGESPTTYLKRQAVWVVLGIVGMAVMALVDYRRLESIGMLFYAFSVFLLLAVMVPGLGKATQGSQRWFKLGPLQIQPSEIAVLALILAVATYCSRRSEGLAWRDVIRLLVMSCIPIALVLVQPDLGTAIIMSVILLVMLAVAGLPNRILVMLLVGAVLVVMAALAAGVLHHYQITRITSFLHQDTRHLSQAQSAAIYNLQQAKTAIGSGGLTGTGLFHGAQINLGYVPEQSTDFIFSAVGEQLGFIGATAVLAVLAIVCWRVLRAGQLSRDAFGRLLCAGIFTFMAFSTFQNASMSMGLMPITGIPLPFISYGGTAVVAFFLGVGVALSVYARRGG